MRCLLSEHFLSWSSSCWKFLDCFWLDFARYGNCLNLLIYWPTTYKTDYLVSCEWECEWWDLNQRWCLHGMLISRLCGGCWCWLPYKGPPIARFLILRKLDVVGYFLSKALLVVPFWRVSYCIQMLLIRVQPEYWCQTGVINGRQMLAKHWPPRPHWVFRSQLPVG